MAHDEPGSGTYAPPPRFHPTLAPFELEEAPTQASGEGGLTA